MVFTTAGFVETLRQPLLEGCSFHTSDHAGGEGVTIINRSMAERYWPEGRALGGTVIMSRAPVRVVGIVENVTWFGLSDEVTNDMYLPLAQSPRVAGSSLTLGVRTAESTSASNPNTLSSAAPKR